MSLPWILMACPQTRLGFLSLVKPRMIHQCNRVKPACQITPKIWPRHPPSSFLSMPSRCFCFLSFQIIENYTYSVGISESRSPFPISTSLCDSRYSALENRRMDDMFFSTTFFLSLPPPNISLCLHFPSDNICHFACKETQECPQHPTLTHSHQNQTQSKCKSNPGHRFPTLHLAFWSYFHSKHVFHFSAPPRLS